MSRSSKILESLKELIRTSPKFKAVIFAFSVIISGVLCSGFITDITSNGSLVWTNFYKAPCFYLLVVYCFIVVIYYGFIYLEEVKTLSFMDKDFCKAYMRKEALPELAKKYREEVRKGGKHSDLIEYHKEFKEWFR